MKIKLLMAGLFLINAAVAHCDVGWAQQDEVKEKVEVYFQTLFNRLKEVAAQHPSPENFREKMRPAAEVTEGFYGATLLDPDFVIREVYNPAHFLARGYDLKKVKELQNFYMMMKENPQPQLSEPGHGNIMQPALIAMRYPIFKDGELKGLVSMMVRTEAFLMATGLDKCKAFKIICMGKLAEERGKLSKNYKEIVLKLPSTEWVIQYE